MIKLLFILIAIVTVVGIFIVWLIPHRAAMTVQIPTPHPALTPTPAPNPLSIQSMRKRTYPGSTITIEQTLSPTPTYNQYIASYISDGLKIYALLTVPSGEKPTEGWPVIL